MAKRQSKSGSTSSSRRTRRKGPKTSNRQGLARPIPEEVKRAVRKACGFGCIFCGAAIVDYDHLGVEFKDAERHDPDKIVLLCPNHHRAKIHHTVEQLAAARAAPKALSAGFARDSLFLAGVGPMTEIRLGSCSFFEASILLRVAGRDILTLGPPEGTWGPGVFSAELYDNHGKLQCRIVRNELVLNAEAWDVEVVGRKLTIRNGLGDIALMIETDPGKSVTVSRLQMNYRGRVISVEADGTLNFGGNSLSNVAMGNPADGGVALSIP